MSKKWLAALTLGGLVVTGLPACATKKFVRTRVAEVNTKVDTLTQSVEETQERTRRNEGAIKDTDQKAQVAQAGADQARQAANTAGTDAKTAGTKADAVAVKTEAIDKASKRIVYTVVLSDDEGQFKFGKSDLPDEAKASIDKVVNQLKAEPNGAFLEIAGYTDSVGGTVVNERIGLERAEHVKRYLFEQHQIPLHKMNVISYGEANPVASNKTSEGRAQNRRIVIRVLI
jgi:outer membrane protein OmpA-like peptidoglycan-associated protein